MWTQRQLYYMNNYVLFHYVNIPLLNTEKQ